MNDITITFVVLALVVALFVIGRIPVGIIAIGTALALHATGVITMEQALAGFGDPTVVFIAALFFVVSEALDATGVTTWAGEKLLVKVGESRVRLVSAIMLLVAALTALISVNGAVAALVPMVVVLAVRLGKSTSQLLLPLAFAAHAGSMLTLTGTPVNIIVSEAAEESGAGAFGFFSFTLVGAPLVLGTIAIAVLLGPHVLPHRAGTSMSPDLSRHAKTLAKQYQLMGKDAPSAEPLITKHDGVVEVIIPPRSEMIGDRAFPGMVTDSGDLVILAVQRAGEDCGPKGVKLAAGDTLLLQGSWEDLDTHTSVDPNVLVVDAPARSVSRQPRWNPRGHRSRRRCGDGSDADVRIGAVRDSRTPRGMCDGAATSHQRRAGASVHLVDHVDSRRRNDPAVDRNPADRRGRKARACVCRRRRWGKPVCRRRWTLRRDGDSGPADQQHCNRVDHHADRDLGRHRTRHLGAAPSDDGHRRCRGLLPDACSHSREHDGDGPWWLQVRRLLEARTPDVVVVPDSCNGVDPSDLEFLMCSPKVLSEVYESIGREGRKISRRSMFAALGTGALGATVMAGAVQPTASAAPTGQTIVDLTHVLTPAFPVWPGARSFEMRNLAKIADAAGSLARSLRRVRWKVLPQRTPPRRTHWYSHRRSRTRQCRRNHRREDSLADLVVPIAVVDISARASVDPDTLLTRQDILDWESLHGTIAPRSLVAMNSGWDTRAGAGGAFTNRDALGVQHTPGFNPEAIDFLVRERNIVAVGSDTLSIDAGRSTTHGAHRSALGSGKYAVEALANLSALPAVGATVMVGAPTHAGGSGGPCRVIAWY